ncbi:MAG: hypothetical protein KDJ29_00455 [Hyphomicrobiales bacterium]|nr:hypothetical protein [Hyphomicrobiales bacterium]
MHESTGPIYDHSKEHLGASDPAVIHFRRQMIEAAEDLFRPARNRAARGPVSTTAACVPEKT